MNFLLTAFFFSPHIKSGVTRALFRRFEDLSFKYSERMMTEHKKLCTVCESHYLPGVLTMETSRESLCHMYTVMFSFGSKARAE